MTFDREAALAWSYFDAAGEALADTGMRGQARPVFGSSEPLLPSRTWAYYEGNQAPHRYLPVEVVDHYRCWPEAEADEALTESVVSTGMTTPIIIYSDGLKGVLGDGQHRLAVAKELHWPEVPVQVIPDRLEVPTGIDMTRDHLRPAEPMVLDVLDLLVRKHMRSLHSVRTYAEEHTVHVFCSCGAQWKRPR